MSWAEVEAVIPEAKAIAWDGCHKIYVALDAEQVEEFRSYGYGDDGSWLIEVTPDKFDQGLALRQLHEWFDHSCSLRMIDGVRTNTEDPNAGFTSLIDQFELDEAELEDDDH